MRKDAEGLRAEKKVFDAVRQAAEKISQDHKNLIFLVFHSVKYGTTGVGPDKKWESDIDVVLVCFNQDTGWHCPFSLFLLLFSMSFK